LNKAGPSVFTSKPGLLFAILIIAGVSACLSGPANSSPTISLSPLPTASRAITTKQPLELTQTPDPARIIASINVGEFPWTMTVADGLLWVLTRDSVVRVDLQTNQVVGKPIPVAVPEKAILDAIAFGQDALWVSIVSKGNLAGSGDIDSILRIDPQTGETVATIKALRGPVDMTYTPGVLWTIHSGANRVSRINTKTNQLIGEPFRTGKEPYDMAVGDGSLWVINHDSGTLTRIDPNTNQIIADIPLDWEPHRVAFGEGIVWVGNYHDLSLSRIDPQTNQVVGRPIHIGYVAGNIAAGYGNVWVTSDYRGVQAFPEPYPDHVVLVRVDPKMNKVVETIPLGGHPVDVEVTEDAVWVSIQDPDLVLKIRP
jgi:YVTN family beta-propeller protein